MLVWVLDHPGRSDEMLQFRAPGLLFVVKVVGEGGVIICQISPHTVAPFSLATLEKAALLKLLPLDHRTG